MTNSSALVEPENQIITWAKGLDSIRAVLLTSTRSIPGSLVDALSDYDVILVVEDIAPFVDNRSWLDNFGEVLIAYWDRVYPNPEFGIEQCANVIQYAHGLKIDFSLWPVKLLKEIVAAPHLPAELDAGYQVLLDKDNLTSAMLPPAGRAYVPARPTSSSYQLLINDFLSDAPYVAKCLWRNELLPAKWCLDYDMKHIYLRQVLEWRVEIDHNWSLPMGNLGKGLTKLLPEQFRIGLEQAYAGGNILDNWQALEHTLELFRQVARKVGDQLGYVYPDGLHDRVVTYIHRIQQLGKQVD